MQKFFWLSSEKKEKIKKIIGHDYTGARIRYWKVGARSVWILNEIGKEKPITMGFIIEKNKIISMDVLAFREMRGYEIRYPFFTKQLQGLTLSATEKEKHQLSKKIDNLTGATLSVNAVRKTAKLALWLSQQL